MEKKQKFSLDVVFDYDGYVDYYSGHGHAFIDKNVLACIRFSVPITYFETVEEIISMIIEDINSRIDPIEFLNEAEDNKDLQEEIMNFVTDERIEKAILSQIPEDVKPTDRFFILTEEEEKEILDYIEEDQGYNSSYLIGYIHVWKEEKNEE
jgi:hypothetical protein